MSTHHTLLLTPWMTPHSILSWQEAVTMLFTGKIRVLETYEGETICSPSTTIDMPAVAMLIHPLAHMKKNVKFSRQNVYMRDSFTCQYCGTKAAASALNYDHVVPRASGGKTDWLNIVTCCYPCNNRKGSRSLKESGMTLLKAPSQPRSLPLSPPLSFKNVPEVWMQYGAAVQAATV